MQAGKCPRETGAHRKRGECALPAPLSTKVSSDRSAATPRSSGEAASRAAPLPLRARRRPLATANAGSSALPGEKAVRLPQTPPWLPRRNAAHQRTTRLATAGHRARLRRRRWSTPQKRRTPRSHSEGHGAWPPSGATLLRGERIRAENQTAAGPAGAPRQHGRERQERSPPSDRDGARPARPAGRSLARKPSSTSRGAWQRSAAGSLGLSPRKGFCRIGGGGRRSGVLPRLRGAQLYEMVSFRARRARGVISFRGRNSERARSIRTRRAASRLLSSAASSLEKTVGASGFWRRRAWGSPCRSLSRCQILPLGNAKWLQRAPS
ncbi:uncharacterized protein Tco025E_08891 [Trypanosoma conorhini]|uniref:Uncharacterized protein n=1 Tax=Trypanosoma conorhini TaxID=83891 RepID=A0A422N3K0_9TRYP|nr:uncharacterized protein Tco025E_08891 [Trypanosoma conorhini]RNF00059.1 hypothetical protein Tco025E_08891 [Trypanosoma conorhini]